MLRIMPIIYGVKRLRQWSHERVRRLTIGRAVVRRAHAIRSRFVPMTVAI